MKFCVLRKPEKALAKTKNAKVKTKANFFVSFYLMFNLVTQAIRASNYQLHPASVLRNFAIQKFNKKYLRFS